MQFDVCFSLIDVDDSPNKAWYQAAASLMAISAKRAFRNHDCRIIQLTDAESQICPDATTRYVYSQKCPPDELAQYRGILTAEWALQADRPAILCDVDLLWNNDGLVRCFETDPKPDIVFTQRPNAFQPFNGGLILTQPHQTDFWAKYRKMMDELPVDIRPWWGDQIALGMMMGTPESERGGRRFGSTVAYLPHDLISPAHKSQPTSVSSAPSIHFKGGKRKKWMADYFDMLMGNIENPVANTNP